MTVPVISAVIPPSPRVIPVVVDADATTSATSVADDEFKFKLFYQKPKNDNVLKDLEMSHMGLKKCQNYIPIYSTFFSLNDTNYNSINLKQFLLPVLHLLKRHQVMVVLYQKIVEMQLFFQTLIQNSVKIMAKTQMVYLLLYFSNSLHYLTRSNI